MDLYALMNGKLDDNLARSTKIIVKHRIHYNVVLAIRNLHSSLFHTASVPDIVNAINACAWLNVEVTAKDVVTVLNKYPC